MFVLCPKCSTEMEDGEDGWYCNEYLGEVRCRQYLTYAQGQAQWDTRGQIVWGEVREERGRPPMIRLTVEELL